MCKAIASVAHIGPTFDLLLDVIASSDTSHPELPVVLLLPIPPVKFARRNGVVYWFPGTKSVDQDRDVVLNI